MTDTRGSWDDWYERVQGEVDPDVVDLAARLAEEEKRRVLDVGCGAGRHLLYLAQQGFEVSGFDFSESAVRAVEDTLAEVEFDADVQVADFAEPFPFADESFDAALATRSINHADLATIEHAVAEIHRVLKPSGLVYVQVPTYEKLLELQAAGEEFEEVEPGTNIPLAGPEEGVPHHNFRREEVLEVFAAFEPVAFEQRGSHYCLLARKP